MVSTNSGATWTRLVRIAGSSGWSEQKLDLSPYVGQAAVLIRFRLRTNSSYTSDGWYIDDVAVFEDAVLNTPSGATKHSLTLSWSGGEGANFARYELYRATHPNVTPSDQLVATINDVTQTTSYTDTGLDVRMKYYYHLYVVKTWEVYSDGSNEVWGITEGVPFPFADDMESGTDNWDLEGTWATTTAQSHSTTTSLTDSPGTLYRDNDDVSLSTGIDLTLATTPVLTFWERHVMGAGDISYVEVSVHNETTWERVHYALDRQTEWQKVEVDLSPYARKALVRLRFRLIADGTDFSDGLYIDDVTIADSATPALAIPFVDDMEVSSSNWRWHPPWGLSLASRHSGSVSFTDSPTGNYADNLNTSLWLKPVDLSSAVNPVLAFWHRYALRTTNGEDYVEVMVSTNSGATWTRLVRIAGSSGWSEQKLDLSPYVGQAAVLIRFRLRTNSSYTSDGWYIDDVAVFEADTTRPTIVSVSPADGAQDVPASTTISVAFSEPMDRPSTEAAFSLSVGTTTPSVAGAFAWGGNTMTFTPNGDLATTSPHTASIDTQARDLSGNSIASTYSWSFTTESQGLIPGDATGDGLVNAVDITKTELIIAGREAPTQGADANQDGAVNAVDITKIELIIAGTP